MLEIKKNAFGTEISDTYTTNLGNQKTISILVTPENEINISAMGSLNQDGIKVFESLYAIAKNVKLLTDKFNQQNSSKNP